MRLKNNKGEKSHLFAYLRFNAFYPFCAFAWLRLYAFCAFCTCEIFSQKKKNKNKKVWNCPNSLIYIYTGGGGY